eukprot:1444878-Rhodomonas_salina.3
MGSRVPELSTGHCAEACAGKVPSQSVTEASSMKGMKSCGHNSIAQYRTRDPKCVAAYRGAVPNTA